jgi:predicted CxxxxCH...CXXCH cytochrome family protein
MKILRYFAILLFISILFGCSKGNESSVILGPTGLHPTGWVVAGTGGNHPVSYLANPSVCTECHGKSFDGGITGISCFNAARNGMACHPGGPSGHPAGWANPDSHGVAAKAISSGLNGFAHCQICHGAGLNGGTAQRSCINTAGCHGATVSAAHSPSPWRSSIGGRTHTTTDVTNATACAVCHTNGANSTRAPSPPAPAGTAVGCFNNTLCHGVEGHPVGWSAFTAHGASAKAVAGSNNGFNYCTQCHGTNYQGGTALQSCLNTAGCHGIDVAAPHPGVPWRSTTGGATHTTTDTSNAGQCAVCHTGGANSSRVPQPGATIGLTGCFNNTLCHGASGHAAGWSAAAVHGAEAKKAPSGSTGFSACKTCHGSAFNNGTATTCFNNAACHGTAVNAPHARKPWTSTTGGVTHTTTDQGNVTTCAVCHIGGANSTVKPPVPATGTPGCFNATMCHFHAVDAIGTYRNPAVHGPVAKSDLTVCQNCHGVKTTTAFDGAVLADGTRTTACSSCHTAAKAHPTDWQGSGTYSHRTAGNTANACTICHDVTQGRTAPLAAAPSCFSTTFTNGLGQARTCHASGPGVAPHAVPYSNHNATARSNTNYCLGCHQDAANAIVPPGCQNCHLTSPVTTSSGCTSCHASPPNATTYPNIAGTHSVHLSSVISTLTNACAECHNGLGFGTLDHLNRSRARTASVQANPVVFSTFAATGTLTPAFNATTGACSSVYCHGAAMPGGDTTGTNRAPVWGDSTYLPAAISAAACATCHGFAPGAASGHPVITIPAGFPATATIGTSCSCHSNVNTAGNSYANIFVNKALHINGVLEVSVGSSHGVPYFNHQSAGTGASCTGCHAIGTAGSVYPAAVAGTPPNCRGCHVKAAPGTVGCGSCHGVASGTGRPNGTSFPDRAGEHGKGAHQVACTTCHPFTSGNTAHGWSGGTKSTNAQVVTTLGWNPGTRTSGTGFCSNAGCHGPDKVGWY